MTTDIKELVKRLRGQHNSLKSGYLKGLFSSAASTIEALCGEVERLTVAAKAADMFHAINGHGIKQAEELADHIIRQMLWGMRIDDSNKGIVRGYLLDHFKAVISRAEKAEAERDRLAGEVEAYESARVTWAESMRAWINRATVAESERDRLKAALEAFVKHFGPLQDNAMLHEGVRNCYRLARKALGGDAS